MQEMRHVGPDVLTGQVTPEQAATALANPNNRAVAFHKPGSTITHSDGRQYIVQADGSWRRVRE